MSEGDWRKISACLFWSSWGCIGDVIAGSYNTGKLDTVEGKFALDLLAYLCRKHLWNNTLSDDPLFYQDKLYRSLKKTDSLFIPYASEKKERDQTWRTKPWEEAGLRAYLIGLRTEDCPDASLVSISLRDWPLICYRASKTMLWNHSARN